MVCSSSVYILHRLRHNYTTYVMKHSLLLCLFLYGICPLYSVAVKQIIAQALYIADSEVSQ